MRRGFLIGVFLSFFFLSFASASFLSELFDPFESLLDEIEEELDNSRVGRELNRIVEDIEAVGRIVRDFEDLASIALSSTPPLAIVSLAIEYGHDPDKLFDRFKERVDSLEGGSGEALSETEIAAALQSVLEEPPLPNGVYMGDSCIVDLSQCPQTTDYRGDYYLHSCYVSGFVDKKNMAGVNTAACTVNWIDTRGHIQITFPENTQGATYDWERCARVLFNSSTQRQFMGSVSQICSQPIAHYELGDVCVVDYTSCGYGASGNLNANRIGTIHYGRVGNSISVYSCRITNGDYALNENLRHECSEVYAGTYEVDSFLLANPEPVQTIVVSENESISPVLNRESAFGLGDIRNQSEVAQRALYGRNGIFETAPPTINEKKAMIDARLQTFGVSDSFNFEELASDIEGREIPGFLAKIVSNEQILLTISKNYGSNLVICFSIVNGIIESVNLCDDSFTPTLQVYTSQSVIEEFDEIEDIALALEDGRITYKATGLGKKIKFGASIFFFKLFN